MGSTLPRWVRPKRQSSLLFTGRCLEVGLARSTEHNLSSATERNVYRDTDAYIDTYRPTDRHTDRDRTWSIWKGAGWYMRAGQKDVRWNYPASGRRWQHGVIYLVIAVELNWSLYRCIGCRIFLHHSLSINLILCSAYLHINQGAL